MIKAFVSFILLSSVVWGYETDQISSSFYDFKDSEIVVDQIVNAGITEIISSWSGPRNDEKVMKLIFKKFSSREFERWVNESSSIDSRNAKGDSIYKTTGTLNSPIIRWKGLASTIKMNGVLLGTDKLSHFFGVGRGLYEKFSASQQRTDQAKEQEAIDWSHFTERFYWGGVTTRVFSNADIVANYEGYLFYRGLLEDQIVNGQKAMIRWEGNRPILQRPFSFREHINDYWSEALNPNYYQFPLNQKVLNVMRTYCGRSEFLANPERFQSVNEKVLEAKYRKLMFVRENQRMTLNAVCRRFERWPTEQKVAFLKDEAALIKDYENTFKNDPVHLADRSQRIEDLVVPIPTCHAQVFDAAAEFEKMEAWSRSVNFSVNQLIESRITIKKSDILALVRSGLGDESMLRIFSLLSGVENVDLIHLVPNAKTATRVAFIEMSGLSQRLSVELSLTQVDSEKVKICQIHSVATLKSAKTDIRLSGCFVVTPTETSKVEINYALRNQYRSRVSQKGYYDVDDKAGFIYRSISDICKWY